MEDLIYNFICFCKKWGMWRDTLILADGKKYSSCYSGESSSEFRGLIDVLIEDSQDDDYWEEGQSEGYLINIRSDGPIAPLIMYGVYEIDLDDASFELKEEFIKARPELIDDWEDFLQEVNEFPKETIGLDPMEFNSYSEYEDLKSELIHDEYLSRVNSLYGNICFELCEFADNIEAEFYDLFFDAGLEPEIYNCSVYFYKNKYMGE